jgi:hypothetical protein
MSSLRIALRRAASGCPQTSRQAGVWILTPDRCRRWPCVSFAADTTDRQLPFRGDATTH